MVDALDGKSMTHIDPGLVLLGHLLLDLQSPEQLFEPHHGHRDQPAGEEGEEVRTWAVTLV